MFINGNLRRLTLPEIVLAITDTVYINDEDTSNRTRLADWHPDFIHQEVQAITLRLSLTQVGGDWHSGFVPIALYRLPDFRAYLDKFFAENTSKIQRQSHADEYKTRVLEVHQRYKEIGSSYLNACSRFPPRYKLMRLTIILMQRSSI